MDAPPRQRWPRIVLTLSPETRDALHELARRNYRDPKREAMRYRWRIKTRKRVLDRDGWRCWVAGCGRRADVADHIDPVGPTTTDAAFYDVTRIRASCRGHNLARPLVGPEHEAALGMLPRPRFGSPSAVVTGDYTRRKPRVY